MWTPENIIALVTALGSLIVALIGAWHGITAKVQSDVNRATIATNATATATLSDRIHEMAVAAPAIAQAVQPQLQALQGLAPVRALESATLAKVPQAPDWEKAIVDLYGKIRVLEAASATPPNKPGATQT